MSQVPRKRINKSRLVREELSRSATGSPSEIVAVLAKKGIAVSAAFVSNIKTQQKKRKAGIAQEQLALVQAMAARGSRDGGVSDTEIQAASDVILKTMDLLLSVGSKKAHELIDRVDQLLQKVTSRG